VGSPKSTSKLLADRSGNDKPGRGDDEGDGEGDEARIELYDDCNSNDAGWAPTGGCTLKGGMVTLEEFNSLLASPLSQSVMGHPASQIHVLHPSPGCAHLSRSHPAGAAAVTKGTAAAD
jgi:hypothetical protein